VAPGQYTSIGRGGTGRGLVVKRAVLGSVRVLRDYIHGGRVPATLQIEPKVTSSIVWRRARLDGKAGYLLRIEPSAGTRCREKDGRLIIEAVGDKPRVSFRAAVALEQRGLGAHLLRLRIVEDAHDVALHQLKVGAVASGEPGVTVGLKGVGREGMLLSSVTLFLWNP
jgi:hypothetical protein